MLGIDWPQSNLRLECCKYTGFMEMTVPLRLFTWHQVCLSADMTKDTQYMIFDDIVHEALIRRPGITREELNKVRGGGRFLLGQNYNPAADLMFIEAIHGDLADFRFYDVALSLQDLKDFALCKSLSDLPSPLLMFDANMTNLELSGDSLLYEMRLKDICSEGPDKVMIVPERINFERALSMCRYFTADIVVPTNEIENMAIYDEFYDFNNHCADSWGTTFWYGLKANLLTGWWTRLSDGKPLSWHFFSMGWDEPSEEHACVGVGAINMKYVWAASPCDILQCPICNITTTPKLHLRGLCKLSRFDRFYSPFNYHNMKPILEGIFFSRITWNNDTWLMKSRLQKGVEAQMVLKNPDDYPFGLHTWDVQGDTCAQEQVQLLLTSCDTTDFTCGDGSCIQKARRCNQEVDCPDNTDELNCELITFPEGYSRELAPPAVDSPLLSLQISLDITSIREFDIMGFRLAIDIIQSIKWRDARLILRNLRPGDFPNEAKISQSLWLPDILVNDGTHSPTDLQTRRVRLLVRRDAGPLPDDDANYSEGKSRVLYCTNLHGALPYQPPRCIPVPTSTVLSRTKLHGAFLCQPPRCIPVPTSTVHSCANLHGAFLCQPPRCSPVPNSTVFSCTNLHGVLLYQPPRCSPVPTSTVFSCTNLHGVLLYQTLRCSPVPTSTVFRTKLYGVLLYQPPRCSPVPNSTVFSCTNLHGVPYQTLRCSPVPTSTVFSCTNLHGPSPAKLHQPPRCSPVPTSTVLSCTNLHGAFLCQPS
ncbi:uncharacterized protein [Panulirus ornatus]|uniref:uncharacterized protein n=1 Tax=Panulirus ornatus TaxID=150431 RepID=UPI003A8BA3CB